jgi:hypothetical protein
MTDPNPYTKPGSPLELVSSTALFRSGKPRQFIAPSIVRLASGRLLLSFSQGDDPGLTDSALMLTRSDDDGETWSEPESLLARPGHRCMNMGGFVKFSEDMLRIVLGACEIDFSLGGDEPFTSWYAGSIDSTDGGRTWSEPSPEIKLFPEWTEMYGASNPHPLSDGSWMSAAMGTMGRDVQWHAGVTFSRAPDYGYSEPVIIANDPDRNYSDTDVVRLNDGRFLAVVREHVTLQSVFSHSEDEGCTWSPIRPTDFKGSNIKLWNLRSGAVACAYRDEDSSRRGVSLSVSQDGGESWKLLGQLYDGGKDADHVPGYVCGYPDMVYTSERDIVLVLHTYRDHTGATDLHLIRLRDVS